MPANIVDVDTFTEPATRPVDGDPGNGATWQAPFQALANRTRWLVGMLGGVAGTGEFTYKDTPRTKQIVVPINWGIAYGAGPDWSRATNPQSDYLWQNGTAQGRILFPISSLLRDGMTISAVKMSIRVGDAFSAIGAKIGLYYGHPRFDAFVEVAPVGVGTQGTSTGAGGQIVSASGVSGHVVVRKTGASRSRDYWIEVLASDATGGGVDDMDRLYGVELTVADPGPRSV